MSGSASSITAELRVPAGAMASVLRWMRPLLAAGVPRGLSRSEERELVTSNLVMLLSLLVTIPDIFNFASFHTEAGRRAALYAGVACCIYAFCYALVALGRRWLGICIFTTAVLWVLTSNVTLVGTDLGNQYYFVIVGVGIAFIWPRTYAYMRIVQAAAGLLLFIVVMLIAKPAPMMGEPIEATKATMLLLVHASSAYVIAIGFVLYSLRLAQRAEASLQDAQEQISRLLQAAPNASESLLQWSRSLAGEIAAAVGAEAIGIWELEREVLTPVSDCGLPPPAVDDLKPSSPGAQLIPMAGGGGTLVPVTGMSGEVCGALVVAGRGVVMGETERRLVVGFAHQLGAALDVGRIRRQLAAAEERRAARRRELNERGIATLQICPRCQRCFDDSTTECTFDGGRLESPRTLPYRLMDRYRFLSVLGEGGMGTVFAARDEKLDRDVAVKLIRAEHFNNSELRQRFEREAHAVARIQHPGVIALYDSGETEDGTAFLVMERLEGSSLAHVLSRYGPGTAAQVAALLRQGSAALAAAHRAGVVHRDIKPANIFLVGEPAGFRVKVLDFGVAKTMAVDMGLTRTGAVIGTPSYMSPEQVRGDDVDARSDLYSFAAVCYEALTGQKVVTGADFGQVVMNVLASKPMAISELLPGLPHELDDSFASALVKDRTARESDIERWGSHAATLLESVAADTKASGWPATPEGRADSVTSAGTRATTVSLRE